MEELFDRELSDRAVELISRARELGFDFLVSFKLEETPDDDYGEDGPLYFTAGSTKNSRVLRGALGVITGRYMPVPATAAMILKLDDATTEGYVEAEDVPD